jgi:D-3-phosphoglycerate dehydrogenase
METSFYDPFLSPSTIQEFSDVKRSNSLKELLEFADVIVVCASVLENSGTILTREAMKALRNGSIVVNTARGCLWDEEAICEELTRGNLAGVGVDVFQFEESNANGKKSPLLELNSSDYNIIFTPHIGGATSDALTLVTESLAWKIRLVIEKSSI